MPRLEDEIKLQKSFASPAEEAFLNLLRTTDLLQIQFTRLFRSHGITMAQYNVLRILRGAPVPLPSLEIANRLVTVVPAITGLIDRLEQAKLVRRHRSDRDRRVVLVELAPAGLEVLAALDKPLHDMHQALFSHMKQADLKRLSRLLEKAREKATE